MEFPLIKFVKLFPKKATKGFFIGLLIGLITWICSSIFSGELYYQMLFLGSALVGVYCGLFFRKWSRIIVIFICTILIFMALTTNIRNFFGGNEKELLSYILTYGVLCLIFGGGLDTIANWNSDSD